MTRKTCIICEAKGSDYGAFHEIVIDGREYIHLCNHHFWELQKYFKEWM